MQRTLTRPNTAIIEALLITFFANRRRLLWVPALIAVAAAAAAALVPVRYVLTSQVLVALGSEYTYRPTAGQPASVGQPLEHEQTMHTEGDIIGSPDLHRATLRAVGVARLYPKYAQTSWLAALLAPLQARLDDLVRQAGLLREPAAPPDLVDLALEEFEAGLAVDVPKTGSIVTVTFRHKDAALGAEALNTLMALYIQRRSELYSDEQSSIVAQQVAVTKAALSDAEERLAQFELANGVDGFDEQRAILLRRRGDLETDRTGAQSQVAQLSARLDDIARQLASVQPEIVSSRDSDFGQRLSTARAALEQVRAQYASALVQYSVDSPQVMALRAKLDAQEADMARARNDRSVTSVRTSQNPAWLSLQDDRLKSETELAVQKTRLAQDEIHLAEIARDIAALGRNKQELGRLQLQLTVSQETYRNATKTLEDRRVTDEVEAHRRATVRVLQPAVPPLHKPPLRKLILGAGAVVALLGLFGATLLAHAMGRTYWQAAALEQDIGIGVLAIIHDRPAGARLG